MNERSRRLDMANHHLLEVGHVAVADTLTISGLYRTLFKIHEAMRGLLLIVSRQALQQ